MLQNKTRNDSLNSVLKGLNMIIKDLRKIRQKLENIAAEKLKYCYNIAANITSKIIFAALFS